VEDILAETFCKALYDEVDPNFMHEISSQYDRNQTDYIEHATELADYADELWK
jgi:hypothetical protein